MDCRLSPLVPDGVDLAKVLAVAGVIIASGCSKEITRPTAGQSGSGTGLMSGSFDSLTYSAPISLSYVAKDGTLIKDSVFPGQVVVVVDPAGSRTAIAQLFQDNGAKVSAQVPNAGLYAVTVNQTKVSSLLSAMYRSTLVLNAFPNGVVVGRGRRGMACLDLTAAAGDASLIQTIDVSTPLPVGCGGLTHMDAVALIASQGGVGVHINDVSIFGLYNPLEGRLQTSDEQILWTLLNVVADARNSNTAVIINMSMGSVDDDLEDDLVFYSGVAQELYTVSLQYPGILNNVLVLVAGSDNSINETNSFQIVRQNFFGVRDHLYFVESQEGFSGCPDPVPVNGLGYVDPGTRDVFSARACDVPITPTCTVSGTSFATPAVANLIAGTYLARQGTNLDLTRIGFALWAFELEFRRPPNDVAELLSFATAVAEVTVTPPIANLWRGATVQLTATLKDVNGNVLTGRKITWTSDDSEAVTISATGLVTGLPPSISDGTSTRTVSITATSEGQSSFSLVTVIDPVASVTVTPPTGTLLPGQSGELAAATLDPWGNLVGYPGVTWTSSNPAVAGVSPGFCIEYSCTVIGVAPGTATITATSRGTSGTATITVVPAAAAPLGR